MSLAATALTLHARPTAPSRNNNSSMFLTATKVLRMNAKNILRSIRQFSEWLRIAFSDFKDSMPIGNMIRFTKIGEESFAFGDFFQSILKIGHTVTTCFRNGIINSICSIRETSLELLWNTFKICKALKNHQIISFSINFIRPLMGAGGMAFAINSAFRFNHERQAVSKIINKPPTSDIRKNTKRNAKAFCRMIRMIKNICTLAVGTIVALAAIYGFMTPGIVPLLLGTTILTMDIAASVIQESNHLLLK